MLARIMTDYVAAVSGMVILIMQFIDKHVGRVETICDIMTLHIALIFTP